MKKYFSLRKNLLFVCFFAIASSVSAQKLSTQEYKDILYKHLKECYYDCFREIYPSNLYITINKKEYTTVSNYSGYGSATELHTIEGYYEYKYSGQKRQYSKFTAIIETKGSIVQKITFRRDHFEECTKLYGEKKRQEEQRRHEEEQKRYQQEQMRFYKSLLNDFCSSKYSNLFSRRNYVNNSIVLTSFQYEENYVYLKGTHSYRGRTGSLYKDMAFEATIEDTGRGYRIYFKKRSAPDMMHSDYYWESGTGTMSYSY